MAKRRKLETPSAADLSRIEEEFRSETSPRTGVAPIAQIAADAASETEILGPETRAKVAEAEAFQNAKDRGLVLKEIDINQIHAEKLVRDRAVVDREELNELRKSISQNGIRLPIEVFELSEKSGDYTYGLISGYRRLVAVRESLLETGLDKYKTIKAIIRTPQDSAQSVAAMVEENEVRSNLTHFERGRIAALSAQSGTFVNVEEAVNHLFGFASKAKRSKIRSFALIFEELGDVLEHSHALTERQGLRLAAALRSGAETKLRDALASAAAETAEDEWSAIASIIESCEAGPKDASRGGRPSSKKKASKGQTVVSGRGVAISWEPSSGGYSLRLAGKINDAEMDGLIALIQDHLK